MNELSHFRSSFYVWLPKLYSSGDLIKELCTYALRSGVLIITTGERNSCKPYGEADGRQWHCSWNLAFFRRAFHRCFLFNTLGHNLGAWKTWELANKRRDWNQGCVPCNNQVDRYLLRSCRLHTSISWKGLLIAFFEHSLERDSISFIAVKKDWQLIIN